MMNKTRCWVLIMAVWMGSFSAYARTIAGVDVPEQKQVAEISAPLVLNGAGVRTKFFFDIYVAALYLPEKTQDMQVILDGKRPKQLAMHFVHKSVTKDKIIAAWEEGFSANLSPEEKKSLEKELTQFGGFAEDAKTGDSMILDYIPGKGTRVLMNNKEKGWIEGEKFNQALLKIWLGEHPIAKKLKQQLLGQIP